MKNLEENKGPKTTDENIRNMLIATDNVTAVSSNPFSHAANNTEEYSVHQLKSVGDRFQAISTKPPTPNQGNIQINRYLVQYVSYICVNQEGISYFEIIQIYFRDT